MQYRNGNSVSRIGQAAAVRLLRRPRALRILEACLTKPQTLTEIAETSGLPLNSAGRYVDRMIVLSILRVESRHPRAGRAIKRYIAVATSFFIPYDAESDELPDDVVRRLVEMRVDEQVRGLTDAAAVTLGKASNKLWGTLIYADRHGSMVVRPDFEGGKTPRLLDPQTPAYLNFYSNDLQLTVAQAKTLQRELVSLLKHYKSCNGPHRYTLSAVLAPKRRRRGIRTAEEAGY